MKENLIIIVNIVSLLISVIAWFFNIRRINDISDLPTAVISKKTKSDNLTALDLNKKILKVAIGLNALNLIIPNCLWKFFIPAITLVVITNILIQLFEEIDTFNVTKGEANVILDFNEKQKAETKHKAEERRRQKRENKSN